MSRLTVLQFFLFLLCWGIQGQNADLCNYTDDTCSTCFNRLVSDTITPEPNQYNMQKAFFPPQKENPVYITVYYVFPDGTQKTWFWSESTYFSSFHPLRIYQFTSLFFGDFIFQAEELTLTIHNMECKNASDDYMMLLTQRVGYVCSMM